MLHFAEDAVERKFIKLDNPISEHYSIMATTLAPIMVNTIVKTTETETMQEDSSRLQMCS